VQVHAGLVKSLRAARDVPCVADASKTRFDSTAVVDVSPPIFVDTELDEWRDIDVGDDDLADIL